MKYTEEKLQEILRSTQDTQTYKAFVQIIKDSINSESKSALYSDLDADSRAYNCGRAGSVLDLMYYIIELTGENDLTEEVNINTDL